ncbi:hypothetical protein MFU01_11860 [Myxococcus fulvus]|uniref:Uncharacterized protein n=1 Tax=Myxococcus fulvus TaxID=33 RepID=A0A511SW71_MYXFU|nr:hypothetical protein MFU01_11860 [Myxococcus fulvus]
MTRTLTGRPLEKLRVSDSCLKKGSCECAVWGMVRGFISWANTGALTKMSAAVRTWRMRSRTPASGGAPFTERCGEAYTRPPRKLSKPATDVRIPEA